MSGATRNEMLRRAARLACAMVLTSLLTACANFLAAPDTNTGTPARVVIAKPAENFSVSGRFSAKRGEQQGNGQFRYEQLGALRTLDLFTPAATQLARIEADASAAKVTLSNGEVREARTLSELLRQFIDIPLSDAEFSAWLQGLPRSAAPSIAADGTIESFRESGWTIVIAARFEGDAKFVRRMRWTFDAGGDAARDAQVMWVFDEFATR